MPQFFSRSSFMQLPQEIMNVIKRFPLTVVASLVLVVTGFMMVAGSYQERDLVHKLLMISILALPLLTALALLGERFSNRAASIIAQGIGLIPLVIYFFALDIKQFGIAENSMPFAFSVLAAYLFLLASPFFLHVEASKEDAWHFDRVLATRFLITFVCGVVLFLGLMLAIGAVQFLFDLHLDLREWYLRTWIIVVGIFGVFFFLHGIPDKKYMLSGDYPKPLKVLFFGILLPLLALFTVILYAYLVRMALTWSWPKEGVAQWVVGFSAAAIACFLLAFPLIALYGWLRKMFTALFGLIIPLLVVLFLGIGIRIAYHGFTINRLIVLMLGIWITAVTLYILFRRLQVSVKYIPLSLAVLIVVSSFGPWNIFRTAAYSQIGRLEKVLVVNGMLKEGVAVSGADKKLSANDVEEMLSILNYLNSYHGLRGKRDWIDTVLGAKDERARDFSTLYDYLVISRSTETQRTIGEESFYLTSNDPTALKIGGYDYMVQINDGFNIPGHSGFYSSKSQGGVVTLSLGGKALFVINAEPLLHNLVANHLESSLNLRDDQMQVDVENANGKARLYMKEVRLERNNGVLTSVHFNSAFLLFTLK